MKSIIASLSLFATAHGSDCNGVFTGEANLPTDVCTNTVADGVDYSSIYTCTTETLDTYLGADCSGTVISQTAFATLELAGFDTECNATDCDYFVLTSYDNATYDNATSSNATCDEDNYAETALLMDYCDNATMATCCDSSEDVCYQSFADADCSIPVFQFSASLLLTGDCLEYEVPDECNATTPTSTPINSTVNMTCNGVDVDVLGFAFTAPTDVCATSRSGDVYYSQMYDCNTSTYNTWWDSDCSGDNYTAMPTNDTMNCGGMDCDYAILTAYNSSGDDCLDDVYGQVPLQMGCFSLTFSGIPLSVEMYCASNESGSDVAAVIGLGKTDCGSGAGYTSYDNVLDAFGQFGVEGVDCMEMTCYMGGFVQTPQPTVAPTAPTAAPTDSPTIEDNSSSATTLMVGLVSFCVAATGLLR